MQNNAEPLENPQRNDDNQDQILQVFNDGDADAADNENQHEDGENDAAEAEDPLENSQRILDDFGIDNPIRNAVGMLDNEGTTFCKLILTLRQAILSKAPLRVQLSPALGGRGRGC